MTGTTVTTLIVPHGTSRPPIPVEITDRIIDFLHGDRISLVLCSLVCKSFLDAAHHHLFHTFRFRAKKASQGFRPFLSFIESKPSFLRYVRVLVLQGRRDNSESSPIYGTDQTKQRCRLCSHALARILQTFPSLENIKLTDIRFSHKRRKFTSALRTRPLATPNSNNTSTQCEFYRHSPPSLFSINEISVRASGSPEDSTSDFIDIFRIFNFALAPSAHSLSFSTGSALEDFKIVSATNDKLTEQIAFFLRYVAICSIVEFTFQPTSGDPGFILTEFAIGLFSAKELHNLAPFMLEHGRNLTHVIIGTIITSPSSGFGEFQLLACPSVRNSSSRKRKYSLDSADWGVLRLAELNTLEQLTFYLDFTRKQSRLDIFSLICKIPLNILSRGVPGTLHIISLYIFLPPARVMTFKNSMDWGAWDEELVKLDLDYVKFGPLDDPLSDDREVGLWALKPRWGWRIEDQLPKLNSLGKVKVL